MRYLIIIAVLLPWFSAEAEEWEARRRPSRRYESKSNWRNVAPTVGLYAGQVFFEGYEWVPSSERVNMLGVWLGLAFHPVPQSPSPFLAVGTELNLLGRFSESDFFEFVPSVRAGVVVDGSDDVPFPDLELYGLGGFRVGNGLRDSTVRVGAGLSIPMFAVAQYRAYKIPFIPWMVEVFYDLSPEQEVGFRFGYHF